MRMQRTKTGQGIRTPTWHDRHGSTFDKWATRVVCLWCISSWLVIIEVETKLYQGRLKSALDYCCSFFFFSQGIAIVILRRLPTRRMVGGRVPQLVIGGQLLNP